MVEMKRSAAVFYFYSTSTLKIVLQLRICVLLCVLQKAKKCFRQGNSSSQSSLYLTMLFFVLFQGGIVSNLMEATNERPWLWVLFIIVIILPFVLIAACCFPGSKVHAWVNETCNVLVYSCFVTIECALTSYYATQY